MGFLWLTFTWGQRAYLTVSPAILTLLSKINFHISSEFKKKTHWNLTQCFPQSVKNHMTEFKVRYGTQLGIWYLISILKLSVEQCDIVGHLDSLATIIPGESCGFLWHCQEYFRKCKVIASGSSSFFYWELATLSHPIYHPIVEDCPWVKNGDSTTMAW